VEVALSKSLDLLSAPTDMENIYTVTCGIEWEVPAFLQANFTSDQPLGEILTFTGGCINAQATTCAKYLATTWPKSCALIENAVQQLRPFSESRRQSIKPRVSITLTHLK
jgi:hypothetical protein